MLPELGNFSIILALCLCLLQIALPVFAKMTNTTGRHCLGLSKSTVIAQVFLLFFAMLCLILSFILNDMTVIYVREHSHQLLPLLYRICAAWGGHEGSLLLWCLITVGWTLAFILFADKNLPPAFIEKMLMVLGVISFGFLVFLFFTSNPFQRDFPTHLITGNDLVPLLQDPGLLFHPPSLYIGYVGFVVIFAFAVTALIEGKLEPQWARACRPWVIVPWAYLGGGIVLGSWWAYRELGWGGWWFWDPVENASLLPWLAATAFLHSVIVSEKRGVFKGWTLLLAILTFSLSLIGTFLVRSGVLVSVHSFASDPTRGIYLLIFLSFIIGGAIFLYSLRVQRFYQTPQFHLLSRETVLLINSIILLISMLTIIIGTLYPIILDSFNLDKLSVGEPYFNTVLVPMLLFLFFLMGFAPHLTWGKQMIIHLWKNLRWHLMISLLAGIFIPYVLADEWHFSASLGIVIAMWIFCTTMQYAYQVKHMQWRNWAMIIAHIGVAIMILSITINKSYSIERQLKISPGEATTLAGYKITFENIKKVNAANYVSLIATFRAEKNHYQENIFPEQRIYKSHEQMLNRPGIVYNVYRDLYISLGNTFNDGSWSVRFYYKPGVRGIWLGGLLLVAGGMLSLFSRRKTHKETQYARD